MTNTCLRSPGGFGICQCYVGHLNSQTLITLKEYFFVGVFQRDHILINVYLMFESINLRQTAYSFHYYYIFELMHTFCLVQYQHKVDEVEFALGTSIVRYYLFYIY
ncbi:Hypothetical_protein [Hexamita inflata]|uniref:Hypothetical_protein n=1 Tax=Hexamita inflata TaxID=28002 RepID=A0AA86NWS4_9EUKA|nr:Hypothetical protein HINF_LOCUS13809 [Hexamita inflata]